MKPFPRIICFALIIAFASFSCRNSSPAPGRAFYYWKTAFRLSVTEMKLLDDMKITTLYIRLFDVDIDKDAKCAVPVGQISFKQLPDTNLRIVPVVYITNKTFLTTDEKRIPDLAAKVLFQISYLAEKGGFSYNEVQFDCDWTESTRDKFFAFLKIVKPELQKGGIKLSATIRLHQIKYYTKTGVPPVDRGMLMCYNMGKLSPTSVRNSIYNDADAGLYVKSVASYPLPLDCALPVFGWGIQIRYNHIIKLLNETMLADLATCGRFNHVVKNSFIAKESFFLHGTYFMKNDIVKLETTEPALCLKAADKVAGYLTLAQRTVALFDLDSLTISGWDGNEFEKIFNSF